PSPARHGHRAEEHRALLDEARRAHGRAAPSSGARPAVLAQPRAPQDVLGRRTPRNAPRPSELTKGDSPATNTLVRGPRVARTPTVTTARSGATSAPRAPIAGAIGGAPPEAALAKPRLNHLRVPSRARC